MSVTIQTGNSVTVRSGNRVTISAPGPQGPPGSGGGGTPGGTNTQVQFNDSGAFGGDAGLTYNKTTDTLTGVNQTFSGLSTLAHIHGSIAGNLYVHVKNTSGVTIAKGTPVYATGSVGSSGEVEVAAADYTNSAKMPSIGITDAQLIANAEGNAVVVGEVMGLATNSYSINQELFVGTAGLLGALPTTGEAQSIAVVSRVHASTGIIVVNAQARLNAALRALANNVGSGLTALNASSITSGTLADAYIASAATWNAKQPAGNYITALTGDVSASGPGSALATLANTAVIPASYTNANITVDSKGRVTAAANGSAGAGDVTGPSSSVDNRIPIFNGTGGKTIEDSGVSITPATAGVSEVYTIDFSGVSNPADYTGANGYLVIYDSVGTVGIWWRDFTQLNSIPAGMPSPDRVIQINITIPGESVNEYIATQTAAALEADSAFSATSSGAVVTCAISAAVAVTGSFSGGVIDPSTTCNVTTQGVNPTIAAISQINGALIEDIDYLKIDAAGTAGSTTFLRGDGSWAVPDYTSGLVDGNKGDVTISFSGTLWTINTGSVVAQKLSDTLDLSAKTLTLPSDVTRLGQNVTGSGSIVLGTSPTLTTPALGTPSAVVLTNATGTAASLTAGEATAALGLKTATTTVSVSGATAPTSGQVLTATSGTAATWQTPSGGGGKVAQVVIATNNTPASTTSQIPTDNTIPQNTEGAEFITATITPTNSSSTLMVEFSSFGTVSAIGNLQIALFRDSTANALQVQTSTIPVANYTIMPVLIASASAGSTSSTTFKIRFGANVSGTAYMLRNGPTAAFFGGANYAILKITEVLP
jgi:hypothetical protein